MASPIPLVPPTTPADLWVELAGGHEADEVGQVGAEVIAHGECLDAAAAAQPGLLEVDRGRLQGRHPHALHASACLEQCVGLAEGAAAHGVQCRVHRLRYAVQAGDDFGGAERGQSFTALRAAGRCHDVSARSRPELYGEPPDAARCAGDEHPPPHQRAEPPQGPQCRHAGHGYRRREAGIHPLWHDGDFGGFHGPQLGPAARPAEGNHLGADWGPGSVNGRGDDHASRVESRYGARGFAVAQEGHVSEVQGCGSNADQSLRRTGHGILGVTEAQAGRYVRVEDKGSHRRSHPGRGA